MLCLLFHISKDARMEVKELVQLWMANGFLQSSMQNDVEMEDIGNAFFFILLENCLLEDVYKDELGTVKYCRMHDLVHDLAQSVLRSQQDGNFQGRCLVTNSLEDEKSSIVWLKNSVNDVLSHFKFLHILKLSGAEIKELPLSIGKLIHLRYLDITKTYIEKLPKSVCKLYNLQTLRLNRCHYLPARFRDLISLRHLHFSSLDLMPLGIGNLTCLQTLEEFIVGQDKGRQIGELRSLNKLRGSLTIRKLDLVYGKEGAAGACMYEKPNLELRLIWSDRDDIDNNNDEDVLEGLQPHPTLKSLTIENFMGVSFPPWLANMDVTIGNRKVSSLENLMVIRLENCRKCEELPMLGQLPHLQDLILRSLHNVRQIGPSFYLSKSDLSNSLSCDSQMITKVFPSLKRLYIKDMPNLEVWNAMPILDESVYRVTIFPQLKELTISCCPNLRGAPTHFPCLEELRVSEVDSSIPLANICSRELTTLTDLYINQVSEITCLPDGLNHNLTYLRIHSCPNLLNLTIPYVWSTSSFLRELEIWECEKLNEIPSTLLTLPFLEILYIQDCQNLKYFPPIPYGEKCLPSLRFLTIWNCRSLISLPSELLDYCALSFLSLAVYNCENLVSFPVNLRQLPSLSFLWMHDCPKLTTLPEGGFGHLSRLRELTYGHFSDTISIDDFGASLNGVQQLSSSLRQLHLYGWPHWKTLPHQIQHLNGLTHLRICRFGLEALPNWLSNLLSLESLWLEDCKELYLLPSIETMQCFTKLSHLVINKCPILKRNCTPESQSSSDSQWPKICHIPAIGLDGVYVQHMSS